MNRNRTLVLLVLLAGPALATEPLTLRVAVSRALERAPELAVSRGALEEASAASRSAGSAFQPEAFVSSTPGYASGMPITVVGRVPAIASVEVRQLVYDGRARAEVHLAAAKAEDATAALGKARADTAKAVLSLYARCFADDALAEAAQRRVATEEGAAGRVAALEREGRAMPLDVERATLALARARQRLLDATSDRDLDQLELRRLVGWPANEPLVLAEDPVSAVPAPPPGDDLEAAKAYDPELSALVREESLAGRAAELASRFVQPTVAAEAQYARLARFNNYEQYFKNFKADDFAVGVSVSIPLFTGGRNDAGAARARATVERVRASRVRREQAIQTEVLRAEAAHVSAGAAMSLAERARAVATEALRLAHVLESEGRGEPEGVAGAERALAQAEEELAKSAYGLAEARAGLLAVRGDLPRAVVP
jgi:outer membrane protein TolC